jgi:hypothetical protein
MQGVGIPPPSPKAGLGSDVGCIEATEQRLRSANTAIAIRIFIVKAPSGDIIHLSRTAAPKGQTFYLKRGQTLGGMQGVGTPPPPPTAGLVSDVVFIETTEQRLRSANTAIAIRIFMVKAPSGPC